MPGSLVRRVKHCRSRWFNILSLFRRFNARCISGCERPVKSKPGSSQRWLQRWHWERQEPEVDSGERSSDGRGQGRGGGGLCGGVRSLRVQRLQRYVGRAGTRAQPMWAGLMAAYSLSGDRLNVVLLVWLVHCILRSRQYKVWHSKGVRG